MVGLGAGDQRKQGGGAGLDPRALLEAEQDQCLRYEESSSWPLQLHDALPKDRIRTIPLPDDSRGLQMASAGVGVPKRPKVGAKLHL